LACKKTAIGWIDHVQEVFGFLGAGVPLVLAPPATRSDPVAMINLCREHSVSRLVLVPSLGRVIVGAFGSNLANELPSLRFWLCSGEPFPKELLESLLKSAAPGSRVLNTYVTTEVAGDVTWAAYDSSANLPSGDMVPIGKAIPPNVVHLLDPQTLKHVPAGETGEIFIEGPHLAVGYHKRPEENQERFVAIPALGIKRAFRTGDFGKLDGDSMIQYAGRKDQQVKVHGQRVEVLQVECALNDALLETSPDGKKGFKPACAVMAIPSKEDPGSYRLFAFVEPADNNGKECVLNDAKLRELMKRSLLPAHIPEQIVPIKALPRLVNGKLDRMTLKQVASEQGDLEPSAGGGVTEELDSFGQIRRILSEHVDGRRIVGTVNAMALFTVILSHWAWTYGHPGMHFDINIPPWVDQWSFRIFHTVDDVAVLMTGVAALHGMGDESKFKFSMWEPCFILGWFVIHISIELFMPPEGWIAYLYFLPLLFCGRMWVILWNKMLKMLGTNDTRATDALSLCIITTLWLIRDTSLLSWWLPVYGQIKAPLPQYVSDWQYVPFYVFGFHFGPVVAKTASKLPISMRCLAGIALMSLGVFALFRSHIAFGPNGGFLAHRPFYHDVLALLINAWFDLGLWICVACLPGWFNLTIQGPGALAIYILHLFFMPCALHGWGAFGVNLFPSISDLMLLVSHVHAPLNGAFEILILSLYIIGFMVMIISVSGKAASLVAAVYSLGGTFIAAATK